jgi:ubiquinone/menaquinone biosynthesis C-methylase UbiE
MTQAEIAQGIERLAPWFYRFDLPHGLHTEPAIPAHVVPIHETRLRMAMAAVDRHFGGRLASAECLDIGSHEGFYSVALAPRVKSVLGVEPRAESRERARFIADAMGVANVEFRDGVVETLGRDLARQFDLTMFLGVLYHVPDPILCLRNVAEVTREMCVIETQVVDEVEGTTEWGAREWTRKYHGVLALVDESGEFEAGNRETGVMPLVTCPSPRALETMLRHAGFRRVEFVEPHEGAYEQLARRKRVVAAAWK